MFARTVLLLFLTCALFAPQAAPAAEGAPSLRVTLLLEHEGDDAWTAMLKRGLARAEREFGLTAKIVTAGPETDQTEIFRKAARESDFVLLASDAFHEILRDNAANFRHVKFGCIDAGIRGPNIQCITFADEQAAYLAGTAAAMLAKSGRAGAASPNGPAIGWLSGADVAALRSLFNGFNEGAAAAAPGIRVLHGCTDSFTDVEAGRREAKRLIAQGVTVLALAAGPANKGALEEARMAGISVIGLDADQSAVWPGHVLTSIIKKVDEAAYELTAAAATGNFKGKRIDVWDLKKGVAIVPPERSMGAKSPLLADISRRMEELRREFASGGIHLKSLRAKTLCDCL